jgi:hypothetical protein
VSIGTLDDPNRHLTRQPTPGVQGPGSARPSFSPTSRPVFTSATSPNQESPVAAKGPPSATGSAWTGDDPAGPQRARDRRRPQPAVLPRRRPTGRDDASPRCPAAAAGGHRPGRRGRRPVHAAVGELGPAGAPATVRPLPEPEALARLWAVSERETGITFDISRRRDAQRRPAATASAFRHCAEGCVSGLCPALRSPVRCPSSAHIRRLVPASNVNWLAEGLFQGFGQVADGAGGRCSFRRFLRNHPAGTATAPTHAGILGRC